MLQKIYQLFLAHRKQILRYFVIGVSAVFLDILTLFVFKEYFRIRPVWSVVINQILILNYVFFLNKYWSFEDKSGASHKQAFRFFILQTFNYAFSVFVMWLFNEKIGFNYLLVRLTCIIIMTSWNFLVYKFWVYR